MLGPDVLRRRLQKFDECLEIDRKIVYEVLQNRLSDLQALKKVFTQFL